MDAANFVRLIVLSAIWGASFLFMRIAAPVLDANLLVVARVGLAALFLLAVARWRRAPLDLGRHWRHFLFLGLFNSALPFVLYAHAAQTVAASLLAILNATTPIWGTLLAAAYHRSRLTVRALTGLALGIAGVAVLVGVETMSLPSGAWSAIGAGILAALCYGIASTYAGAARAVEPLANAHGSMWAATLWLLPAALYAPTPAAPPNLVVLGSVLALGIVCSGIAYLLYFRLIAEVGAAPALTVTFLIPVFGVLWGALVLDEAVGWHTLAGTLLVLAGTAAATRVSLPAAWRAVTARR